MSSKLRVGILGATGVVGQRFIQMLERHPQFVVSAVAASDRLLTTCPMPQWPWASRARLLDTQRRCGQLSQEGHAPKLR